MLFATNALQVARDALFAVERSLNGHKVTILADGLINRQTREGNSLRTHTRLGAVDRMDSSNGLSWRGCGWMEA